MLKTENQNQRVAEIVEKYGPGFDEVYYWGMEDNAIIIAKKFLELGGDMDTISHCTGISIEKLKEFKRKP